MTYPMRPLTPEELERSARSLPRCPTGAVPRTGWRGYVAGEGKVQLSLPPDFKRISPDPDLKQLLWQMEEDRLVLLSIHDGTASTVISPAGVAAVESFPRCSVEVVGRIAEVHRAWVAVAGKRYFSAAVDVAVEQGFGVGAAILSSDDQAWEIFVGLLQSIKVTVDQ